jgi:hypothetical protein
MKYFVKKLENKLMLCNRNVQVGDECHHLKYPEIGKWSIKEGGVEDCVDWHGENVDPFFLYKVIGEISLEATWVKEGDEFDEDQINIWAFDGEDGWNFSVEEWCMEEQEHSYDDFVVTIKGPCGYFH